MEKKEQYVRASDYDLPASRHNFLVFHRRMTARPWRAAAATLGMGLLAANGFLNLIRSPTWDAHPWMGWTIGTIALVPACYFLTCAIAWVVARARTGRMPGPPGGY